MCDMLMSKHTTACGPTTGQSALASIRSRTDSKLTATQGLSYDEQLLQAAVRFLLEGREVYSARILLGCSIEVARHSRHVKYPRQYTVWDVDVAFTGPRAAYDALETHAHPIGESIRRSFSAVITQDDRLVKVSARLRSQPVEGSDWRSELWARADDVEATALRALAGGNATTQVSGDAEHTAQAEEQTVMSTDPDARKVFVVHGRDMAIRNEVFTFLRSIGLQPLEWAQAVAATRIAAPYVGQILDTAFSTARAVVVLLTPDDEARLREVHWGHDEPDYETKLTPQSRPNVLFEAGMALGRHPNRTVLVEFGPLRPFSDVLGRHTIRMDDSIQKRQDLAQRLLNAGCAVDLSGTDWHTAGTFSAAPQPPASMPPPVRPRPSKVAGTDTVAKAIPPHAPLLVPDGTPTFHENKGNWLKWDERSQSFTITNHGQSPAFNVAGVLYGCESYIFQGNRDTNSRNEHWTCWLGTPVPANGALTATFEKGNGIFFYDNKVIAGYAFNAPPEPGPGEILQGKAAHRTARVVITYQDVGGQKYTSIFDYVPHHSGWERVATLPVDRTCTICRVKLRPLLLLERPDDVVVDPHLRWSELAEREVRRVREDDVDRPFVKVQPPVAQIRSFL